MKKLSVSIGIPAYNEEGNIKKLLESLLKQKGSNFILQEIIVVSDFSTDHTSGEVKSVKSKKIKLIENKKRLGQAVGQNKIVKLFSGDVLVLLNADILPQDSFFFQNLVEPFAKSKKIGIVSPKTIPLTSESLLSKILRFSANYKNSMFEKWKRGENLYLCVGRARAFKREFIIGTQWPNVVTEDVYSYFDCLARGYKFFYQPKTSIYYSLPDRFSDHAKQSWRYVLGMQEIAKLFPDEILSNNMKIPLLIVAQSTVKYFLKSPIMFVRYFAILIRTRIIVQKSALNLRWDTSSSTKSIKI